MANSYSLPTEGNQAFVNTDAFIQGKDITAESLSRFPTLNNYNQAYVNTGVVISQGFPDGVLYNTSPTLLSGVLRYRVPMLSDKHLSYRIILEYSTTNLTLPVARWKVTGASGSISYHSHTLSLTGGAGVKAYSAITPTPSTDATGPYKTLELELQHGIIIHHITIEIIPLSNPLTATGTSIRGIDGTGRAFIALDDGIFASQKPISADKMHRLIGNIEAIQMRPRCLFNFSGPNLAYQSVTNPYTGITTKPQTNLLWRDLHNIGSILLGMPYFLNPNRISFKIIAHMFVASQSTAFNIQILGHTIAIPANSSGWKTYTWDFIPSYPIVKAANDTFDGITPKFTLYLNSDTLMRSDGYRYDSTPIQSLNIFGV